MADHLNAARVRERSGSGDLAEMAERLVDEVTWHQIGAETIRRKQFCCGFDERVGPTSRLDEFVAC